MDWKTVYKERLMTAEEAVTRIKSGDRLATAHAVGEPTHIIDAMVKNKEAYRDVEIVHMVSMGKSEYAQPGMEPYFMHNSVFVGAATRGTIKAGHGDFTPCFFSQIPNLFYRTLPLDVAIIHVCPPDDHGYCSCGVSVDYGKTAAEQAKTVIAQVNKYMPRTLGDTFVHVSQMD
ncbi:MAG: 4-hydroxybutyrate CoA-transferase, partial [Oscillospiraceae bacterium]|nr:4-hydroxybutyrate CoA-transferase [Oscillospiraceae bacterium]